MFPSLVRPLVFLRVYRKKPCLCFGVIRMKPDNTVLDDKRVDYYIFFCWKKF